MINHTTYQGNVTDHLEVHFTSKTATPVLDFSVAHNKKRTLPDGTQVTTAVFLRCRALGKTAEFVAKCFSKGQPILLEGELAQETWQDKTTGKTQSKTLLVVQEVHFCGGDRKEPAPQRTTQPESQTGYRPQGPADRQQPRSVQQPPQPLTTPAEESDW